MQEEHYIPILTIAGSDSSGGAGIQADLKTFAALGCYGTSAITAVTVQNTLGVTDIHSIPSHIVAGQIKAVIDDIRPFVIKIGMTHSKAIVEAISGLLVAYPGIPVILDPVMISSSGRQLLGEDTVVAIQQQLLPLTTLVTPNLDEAAVLSGITVKDMMDMRIAAEKILETGCKAVLVKGGHLPGTVLYDLFLDNTGKEHIVTSDAIATDNTHGTGCTLSAAIASFLARGEDMITAIEQASTYMHTAIATGQSVKTGKGHGPVNHFFNPIPQIKIQL